VVHISDTHNFHNYIALPHDGDLLLHTGDMVGNYNANYEIDVVSQFKDFLDWILAHDCFQSWTPPPHFSEDTKKLILRPAMTEKQFFRGLSPLVFADRDQTEIQLLANEQPKLQADYTLQLTAAEAAKLEAKALPMPRKTEKVQLYLKHWMLFLDKVFGPIKCELIIQGRQFNHTLQAKLPRIMSTGDFMDRRGNSILWELAITAEAFWHSTLLKRIPAYQLQKQRAH
jgi:hypothetical protein